MSKLTKAGSLFCIFGCLFLAFLKYTIRGELEGLVWFVAAICCFLWFLLERMDDKLSEIGVGD